MLSRFSHIQLCDAVDSSPPGSSAHGILQARILEQVAIPSSRGSSWPMAQTLISNIPCLGIGFFSTSATCCCCSVTQLHPTLCNPMDSNMPGFPVHHQLPELAQSHVHQAGDAIQPSHPLSSPSPAFNLSQHQGLFKRVSSSHQVAKVLEFQHQSFQWIFRTDFNDTTQPSHPLSSPSHPAFNLSQRRGLFQWISSPHQVTKY